MAWVNNCLVRVMTSWPQVLAAYYFRQRLHSGVADGAQLPGGVVCCAGPGASLVGYAEEVAAARELCRCALVRAGCAASCPAGRA